MSKIIAVIIIIAIAGVGYWFYQSSSAPEVPEAPEVVEEVEEPVGAEQVCINSGGQATTSLCCMATEDFPNLCLIGACGCAPEDSQEVSVCDCGPEKCFDGNECVAMEPEL